MPLTFTYDATKVGVQAKDTIRFLLRDVKPDRMFLMDEEIVGMLLMRGLVAASDPIVNRAGVYQTAAECCRAIQAKFASESEIAITQLGASKSTAGTAYARLAEHYEAEAISDAAPSFLDPTLAATATDVNPNGYPNDWVAGVDSVPDLSS